MNGLGMAIKRLEAVEKQNRRMKIVGGIFLLTFAVLAFVGWRCPTENEIVASSFVLHDDEGNIRAMLSMEESGPSLVFHNEFGEKRMALEVDDKTRGKETTALYMYGGGGRKEIALVSCGLQNGLRICTSEELSQVNSRIEISGNRHGTGIYIYEENMPRVAIGERDIYRSIQEKEKGYSLHIIAVQERHRISHRAS